MKMQLSWEKKSPFSTSHFHELIYSLLLFLSVSIFPCFTPDCSSTFTPKWQIYSFHQWTHPPSTLHGTPVPKLSCSLAPKFNISSRGTTTCIDFSPWKWTLGAVSHPGDGGQCRLSLTTLSAILSRLSFSSDLLLLLTRWPADLYSGTSPPCPAWASANVASKT